MKNPICIYHGNCADGFGAAWAVWKQFPEWEFYPGVHQTDPPDVTDRDVVIVDFSYKSTVLQRMKEQANSILVLDHHKTAEEDLASVADMMNDGPFPIGQWMDYAEGGITFPDSTEPMVGRENLCCWFDMDRSGAMMAWRYFHSGQKPPRLVEHIQDRDLWRFELDGTREIQAALFSYPYDFDTWDKLILHTSAEALRQEGEAIERKHHKDVAELVAVTKRRMSIAGHDVPVASLPYTLVSDAAHMMADGEPFAACYWDTEDKRIFGLRSQESGEDVSEVAKLYGGGGHKHAAGFAVPRDHALARA